MRERALRFGQDKGLVGILTEPKTPRAGAPAVLYLNSGLVHRIGASRMHVHMARALAAEGFTGFRFDFSGIGDSEPRKDGLTFEEAAVLEVREAMNLLASRGATRFLLVGLCSGADMAYSTALADERVVAICQLDPFVYRTRRFYVGRYGPRLVNPTSWRNLISGQNVLGRKLRGETADASHEAPNTETVPPPYWRAFPPKEEVEAGLTRLVARAVSMLAVFTSGQPEHYNYEGQYRECFDELVFGDILREEYYADADHVFTGPVQQRRLVALVVEWARGLWPD